MAITLTYTVAGAIEKSQQFKDDIESISLEGNDIVSIDLSPLSSCNHLESLNLYNNRLRIIDLGPLQTCKNFQSLNIVDNPLSSIDLVPLSSCLDFRTLDLDFTSMGRIDLSPLKSCSKLEGLGLTESGIDYIDLAPLSYCTALRLLSLGQNRLRGIDLEPLSECVNLILLELHDNRLDSIDLSPLKKCTKLDEISLDRNPIDNLDLLPLKHCSHLRSLSIGMISLDSLDVTPLILFLDQVQGLGTGFVSSWLDSVLFEQLAPKSYWDLTTNYRNPQLQYQESWSSIYDFVVLMKGTSRYIELTNGILRRFGLGHFGLVDIDLTDLFLAIPREKSLKDTRGLIESNIVGYICDQIDRSGTTMGLDTTKCANYPEIASRIPDVLDLRLKELNWALAHDDEPNIGELILTAYGFAAATALNLGRTTFVHDYNESKSILLEKLNDILLESQISPEIKNQSTPTVMSENCKNYIFRIFKTRSDFKWNPLEDLFLSL
ncbi:MAG: leucine-rich repeat domain-containing protein [Candidatus Thorarchaeota archaeon]|jgi:hypothetical protein